MLDKKAILLELDELIKEGDKMLSSKKKGTEINRYNFVDAESYYNWRIKTLYFLKLILTNDNELIEPFVIFKEGVVTNVNTCCQSLHNIRGYIEKDLIVIEQKTNFDTDNILETIFSRFHKVARQLRSRYSSRKTLEIEDEYDVQDLLHALLQLYFDDIRAEEWTPSYAGKSARMDFLLKSEKVVIEVKKTRQGLTDKELGDQLIIDVDRYKEHPDCERLICFVYDPEGRVGNPNGLITDLNERHEGFATVIIKPDM